MPNAVIKFLNLVNKKTVGLRDKQESAMVYGFEVDGYEIDGTEVSGAMGYWL